MSESADPSAGTAPLLDAWPYARFLGVRLEVREAGPIAVLPFAERLIGNPILPVIKISGNPRTVRTMSEHIDLDVSGILRRDMTISQAGDALIEMIARTANGRLTAAEALGHREFVLTKLYRSA